MSSASIHDKLGRVRKPRVHITYKVYTGDAQVERELPFIVGVLGDFSGNPTEPLKPLRDRKFIAIDRDNFDQVLDKMKVTVDLHGLTLSFREFDDFHPDRIYRSAAIFHNLDEHLDRGAPLLIPFCTTDCTSLQPPNSKPGSRRAFFRVRHPEKAFPGLDP